MRRAHLGRALPAGTERDDAQAARAALRYADTPPREDRLEMDVRAWPGKRRGDHARLICGDVASRMVICPALRPRVGVQTNHAYSVASVP